MEDKLTLFRQQAAIIARKKESTAEKLNDVRVELAALEDEIKDKKSGKNKATLLDVRIYPNVQHIVNSSNLNKMVNTQLSKFSGLAAYAGESVPLRGDDFKRYVNSLRGKVGVHYFNTI